MSEGGTSRIAKQQPIKLLKLCPHKTVENRTVNANLSPQNVQTDNSQIVTHLVKIDLPYYYNYKI